jgi:hypothetical protein
LRSSSTGDRLRPVHHAGEPALSGVQVLRPRTGAAPGYDIVVNAGDQESDLEGGHADRAFKLPNPFYFVSD